MKRYFLYLIVSALIPPAVFAQLVPKKLIVPVQFQKIIDSNTTVMLPDEYEMSVYYTDPSRLLRPRFMALSPNNTICVADMNGGHILALPDANHDGIPDTVVTIAPLVDTAHSIAFYNGDLYVAQPSMVRKFADKDGDGFFETEEPFISGIGDTGYYNHFTRTILFDTAGKHIYLSVGASCNACRVGDPERASILQFNLDGSGRRIFATGLRNALGLAINPSSGALWAANADRDNLGDEVPPEIITSVSDGAFYGWPFAYDDGIWDNFNADAGYRSMLPITSADTTHVQSMHKADIQIPAHLTPMGILFYKDPRVYIIQPPLTAFVALHGSSSGGRTVGRGYKVIKLVYDKQGDSWSVSDFLTGFLTDSINYSYWGRPCGIVQDSSGDIFLSSDAGIPAIYRIHLINQNSVHPIANDEISLSIYPNPVSTVATIYYTPSSPQFIKLELIDELGRVLRTLRSGSEDPGAKTCSLSAIDLPDGVYFLRLQSDAGSAMQKFIVTK